jgi:predicted ester cyclase
MSAEDNLNRIVAGFEAVSARDIDKFLSYLDPDFRLQVILKPLALHQQGTFNGKEGFRYYLNLLFTSFPDFHMDQIALRANGNMVYHEIVIHGTHQAAFTLPNGIVVPPSGMRVELPLEVYHTFDPTGRFISSTSYINLLVVLIQFGT